MFGDCEWPQSGLASWVLVCFLQQHCSHSASEATVVPLAAPGKPAGHISALCLQAASQTHQQWCKCLLAWQLAGSYFCLSGKPSLVLKVSWRNWVENCYFPCILVIKRSHCCSSYYHWLFRMSQCEQEAVMIPNSRIPWKLSTKNRTSSPVLLWTRSPHTALSLSVFSISSVSANKTMKFRLRLS